MNPGNGLAFAEPEGIKIDCMSDPALFISNQGIGQYPAAIGMGDYCGVIHIVEEQVVENILTVHMEPDIERLTMEVCTQAGQIES